MSLPVGNRKLAILVSPRANTNFLFFQLNDNNICRVNRYAFRDTASLRSLSLKNNRLTRLPQDAFNSIKNQIMQFDVAGNAFTKILSSKLYDLGLIQIKFRNMEKSISGVCSGLCNPS